MLLVMTNNPSILGGSWGWQPFQNTSFKIKMHNDEDRSVEWSSVEMYAETC